MAVAYPAWETWFCRVPTVRVPPTGDPEPILQVLEEDLLPRCPSPLPHITVHLSGRGCRAARYLEFGGLDHLEEDLAAELANLLASVRPRGFGHSYHADLTVPAAWALIEDWNQILERADAAAGDRRALEGDAFHLRCTLELAQRQHLRALKGPRAPESCGETS